jgi:hypothetical protein
MVAEQPHLVATVAMIPVPVDDDVPVCNGRRHDFAGPRPRAKFFEFRAGIINIRTEAQSPTIENRN